MKTPIPHLLILTLILPPHVFAEGESSMGSGILGGLTSAMSGMQDFYGAYGLSAAQMGAMQTQIAATQAQANGVNTAQSQFDQIYAQLDMAKMEAQQCIQKYSNINFDKYYAKRKGKEAELVKNMSAEQLKNAPVTCSTAAVVTDAVALHEAKKDATEKKIKCLTKLRDAMDLIASKAQAPFQALTDAATQVVKTQDQIIGIHKSIVDKINLKLDGTEGRPGYRAQLDNLVKMQLELNDVINGAAGGKTESGWETGLATKLDKLKQARTGVADRWYNNMIRQVEGCFQSQPAKCFNNNRSMPPAACLSAMIDNNAVGSLSKGTGNRAEKDKAALNDIAMDSFSAASDIHMPANLDSSKPDQFITFFRARFKQSLGATTSNYANHQYRSKIDPQKISQFVNERYQACYAKAEAAFKADLGDKGASAQNLGRYSYYADGEAANNELNGLANNLKGIISRVSGQMSEFRKSFFNVYNSELNQFAASCTGNENPNTSLDCLRTLNATLESGINGTTVRANLSSGSKPISAGPSEMQIDTLTTDAAGKPTPGSTSVSCVGFKDCIDYLDRNAATHQSAQEKTQQDRSTFAENHNNAVRSSLDIVGRKFAEVSETLNQGLAMVNASLSEVGVGVSIEPKNAETEELVEDENTNLIKMPKSLKAAIAGRTAFTEFEKGSDEKVVNAYNEVAGEIGKKKAEALGMSAKCKIEKEDYKTLLGIMPKGCTPANQICARNRMATGAATMEDLLKRSVDKIDDNENTRVLATSDYKSCVADAKAEVTEAINNDDTIAEYAKNKGADIYRKSADSGVNDAIDLGERAKYRGQMKKELDADAKNTVRGECSDTITNSLMSLAAKGRGTLANQNRSIVQKMADVNSACMADEAERDDLAEKACQDFVKSVNAAKPPENEDPTGAAFTKGSSTSDNPINLQLPTAK